MTWTHFPVGRGFIVLLYGHKGYNKAKSVYLSVFCGYTLSMKKTGRPRQANRRTEYLEIRLTANEKRAFQEAAQISGISVSTWVRERLRRSVIRELEEAGRSAAYLLGA